MTYVLLAVILSVAFSVAEGLTHRRDHNLLLCSFIWAFLALILLIIAYAPTPN